MRATYQFLKATMIGGLVVLLPVIVILALVAWACELALSFVMPLFAWLPDKSVGGVSLTVLAAIGFLVVGCFFAGLLAETTIIQRLTSISERLAMSVPGYALMKNVGANLVGIESKNLAKTVLVRFESSYQLGILMETLPDGRHVVFVPGVPRALVGTLHIVTADRVQVLAMTVTNAIDILGRLGIGLGETLPKSSAG
jgi:uncharacterized membrane protein